MSDERLREAERRWRETGAVEDEARLFAERVRVGDLDPERLGLAACVGHPPACLALGLRDAELHATSLVELVRDRSWPAAMAGLVAWAEQVAFEVPGCAPLAEGLRAATRSGDPLDRELAAGEAEARLMKERFVVAGAFEEARAAGTMAWIYEHARGWPDQPPRDAHDRAFRRGVVAWALDAPGT